MTPTKTDRRLWHRLEGYSFHERPLTRSLVDQLRDKTGHTVEVCYILLEEYRRFIYLVGSTGETLSPSPIVDLVWRLHVADHAAYFDDFCPRIIGRTLHHPGDLPPPEDDPAYGRTLDCYAREFGRPQVQYWPDPDFASLRTSGILLWVCCILALILSVLFSSVWFAGFASILLGAALFLKWKFSSLPLYAPPRKGHS